MTPLTKEEEFSKLLKDKNAFVVYKHSTNCSRSAAVKKTVEKFLATHSAIPFYEVLVIEYRALSNAIAEILNIRHESPQIFFIKNGEVTWHAHHLAISERALQEKLAPSA